MYQPFVYVALRRPKTTLAIGVLALLSAIPAYMKLGSEFMPPLNEGDLMFMPIADPSISLEENTKIAARQNAALMTFPEVASVVAKVVRDRMMTKLAARYPGYGWEHNQGYATRDHREAIRRLGLTPFHRRSFLALQRTLAGDQLDFDLLGDPAQRGEHVHRDIG